MTIPRKTLLSGACATLALLTGCAGSVPPYVEPPVANVAVKDTEARIVMRSAGMPMAVNYAMSTSESICEGFAPVGRVFHSGREQLLPWIATLTEKSRSAVSNDQPQVEQVVPANRRVQVKGYSGWSDVTAQMRSSGSCGPLTSRFTPAGGKTYLVEFRFAGTRDCSQTVYEIDAAEQRLPVEQSTAPYCSR